MRVPATIALQAAALLGAAGLCALLSNGFARPERRLTWTATPPAPANAAPIAMPAPLSLPPAEAPKSGSAPQPKPAREAATQGRVAPELAFPPLAGQPIREITSKEAERAAKAGALFLDARRSAEYELGHIKGAWSLPIWEDTLEGRLIEFEAKANPAPEGALVLYCSGGSCEDSHLLASKLFQMGYRNLLIYREGYPDWVNQGRPIAIGPVR